MTDLFYGFVMLLTLGCVAFAFFAGVMMRDAGMDRPNTIRRPASFDPWPPPLPIARRVGPVSYRRPARGELPRGDR